MAEMELVIKIPEEMYGYAKRYNSSSMLALREMSMCMNAVANGTSLPKGHGDLVDRNCICKAIYASDDNLTGSGMTYDEMDFYNDGIDSMWDKLQNADVVIKAEGSDSE